MIARCESDLRGQQQALRDRFRTARTPDEAIAHALLGGLAPMRETSVDLDAPGREFRAARQRWPADLDLAWFSVRACGPGCDRQAEARHLLDLDPDNAAAWMVVMELARERQDDVAYDAALHRAAHAKFNDPRTGATYLRLRPLLDDWSLPDSCRTPDTLAEFEAALGHPLAPGDWADVFAMGMELAAGMGGFSSLEPCRNSEHAMGTSRRTNCIALLSRVAAGDTVLEQSIALSMLIPLVGDSPRGAQLRERLRQLRWLQAQSLHPGFPPGYAARVWSQGEIATLRAYAIAQRRWPPPPDWLPEDARSRALIQTGRPSDGQD